MDPYCFDTRQLRSNSWKPQLEDYLLTHFIHFKHRQTYFLTQVLLSLSFLSSQRAELEVRSMTTIKLKLLTELTYQANVIDGTCQRCQELV